MYKTAIFLGIASIFIPVAVYSSSELEDKLWALLLLLFGACSLIMAIISAYQDETAERRIKRLGWQQGEKMIELLEELLEKTRGNKDERNTDT